MFYKNAAQRHFLEQYIVKGAALKSPPKALPLETARFLKKAGQKL